MGQSFESFAWTERLQHRPRVLCIDDDPAISLALQLRLRSYEVEVLRAFHGMQGFWIAQTEKPDLIITDLAMPMGDGESVAECLKNNATTRHIPVFVLTGSSDPKLAKRMRRLGVEGLFVKPLNFDELRQRLEEFIPLSEPLEALVAD